MVSNYIKASLACPDDSGIVFTIKQKAHAAWIKCLICNQSGAECLRCRLRSRAVKRAYFALAYTAMHAHPVRRRTAPVSYVRRHAPYGALYGYCIKAIVSKLSDLFFYQTLPHRQAAGADYVHAR